MATIAIAVALMATAAAPELLEEYAPSEALAQGEPATPNPSGQAATALTRLPVKGPAPMTGYDRTEKFGPAWSDDVSVTGGHNGCDTRIICTPRS